MKNLKSYLTIFALAFFCFMLSSPAAFASNIVIDDDAQPAVSGMYLTSDYTDDAACIQAALDNSKSGDTITIREGDYYITKRIYQKGKNLNIVGEGKVTLHLQTPEGLKNGLYFTGSTIKTTTLAANAQKGSSTIVLSDASQVRPNDLIKIWKDVQWCPLDYPDQKTGEMYYVESVSGNVVTLNQPLLRDYKLSDSPQAEINRPIEMHIKNIGIQDNGATAKHMALTLEYCKDGSITDSWIKDSGLAAISMYSCFNMDVNNNEIYNSILSGSGYGVGAWSGSAFINIHNNYIENCRHCITGNTNERCTLIRDITISDNEIVGASITGSNPIDAHAITLNYVVTRNKIKVQSGFYAFLDGSFQSEFSENEVYGGNGAVVRRGNVYGGTHIIKDNYVEGSSSYTYRAYGGGTGDTLIIENNSQKGGRYGVYFSSEQPESFKNIIIKGNRFSNLIYNGAYHKFLINGVNLDISDNTFENIGREGVYIDGNSFTNGPVKIQNNVLINVYPSNPGSEITVRNIQNPLITGNQISGTQIAKVPVAAFSAPPNSGCTPLTVKFTDKTTNSPTAWNWNFGDGTTDSKLQNPTHIYSIAGNYTVVLTASNAAGSSTVTGTVSVTSPQGPVSEEPVVPEIQVSDNRLREASPDIVFQDKPFIDVGGMSIGRYRDVMWFNLSEYAGSTEVSNAILSLYWYYPSESTRPEDTVIEIYRPASAWSPNYVSWNNRDKDLAWMNPGGDWYDKNGVLQGSTPYATITFKGSDLPDNIYHEIDVTDLVNEYVSGKYENTGFLIKARTESNNYIAFYSSGCGNESQIPKLNVTKKASTVTSPVVTVNATINGAKDNRLREASPETVFQDKPFIDVGGINGVGRYRDVMWFNLSEYTDSTVVINANLSLYWYHPSESTRPEDTVIEIYRPASAWSPNYVSWNNRDKDLAWMNPGGDWYDKNGVLQGSTPYATITFKGSDLPDNIYHEIDVTDLVNEYVSGKYENTGFLIKTRTESNNYIAFYSSDCGNENQEPKLQLEYI
ncbi:hypothetical protein MSMAC_1842 [Methanosarcina mazei C16]|uniref:PKD domain-containing protein n=4 Tax=Methanosarcina mazei TaxID=2209 RepID=A0A0E3RZ06_METMZ|nr:disaggregatase related repeat-containing protein [Methanosarcina mazei]AKB71732.1 hypothetical protein MSMAC_1842 [Methanosarcina mazei C16]